MADHAQHPDEHELRDFIAGKLDETRSKEIETHLQNCSNCNQNLLALPNDDPLVSLVRHAGGVPPRARQIGHATVAVDPTDALPTLGDSFEQLPRSFGRYEILGELGRGGMGIVFRARDRELKREIALKVILSGSHSAPAERGRFRQEAETIARLQHPNIVQIFEVGEFNGQPYLALELVAGKTLGDVTKGEPQPLRWSATMILQLAQAVHFAHQQSVVHRDLKPGNVLLVTSADQVDDSSTSDWTPSIQDSSGSVPVGVPVAKITDFGLAKQLDEDQRLTETGSTVGTPAYMAPEQAGGHSGEIGPTTDVYALGAILYELLTGRPPFIAGGMMATLRAVIDDYPESPRELRQEVPRDLETICLKCLSKETGQRYASARNLATDLELFLQGDPIHARPLGMAGRILRWARQRPQLAMAYFGCIVLLVLHLIARHVLELSFHTSAPGKFAPFLVGGWAVAATLLQYLSKYPARTAIRQYIFAGLVILGFTILFGIDAGPQTAPVPVYLVLIAGSALLLPRPQMVWFVAGCAVVGYSSLVAHAYWYLPEHTVSPEHALAFLFCLVLMGACMHLNLRRPVRQSDKSQLR